MILTLLFRKIFLKLFFHTNRVHANNTHVERVKYLINKNYSNLILINFKSWVISVGDDGR